MKVSRIKNNVAPFKINFSLVKLNLTEFKVNPIRFIGMIVDIEIKIITQLNVCCTTVKPPVSTGAFSSR